MQTEPISKITNEKKDKALVSFEMFGALCMYISGWMYNIMSRVIVRCVDDKAKCSGAGTLEWSFWW